MLFFFRVFGNISVYVRTEWGGITEIIWWTWFEILISTMTNYICDNLWCNFSRISHENGKIYPKIRAFALLNSIFISRLFHKILKGLIHFFSHWFTAETFNTCECVLETMFEIFLSSLSCGSIMLKKKFSALIAVKFAINHKVPLLLNVFSISNYMKILIS